MIFSFLAFLGLCSTIWGVIWLGLEINFRRKLRALRARHLAEFQARVAAAQAELNDTQGVDR